MDKKTYLVVGEILTTSEYSGRICSGLQKTEVKASDINDAMDQFKLYWKNPAMGIKSLVDIKIKKVFELVWN